MKFTKSSTNEHWRAAEFAVTDSKKKRNPRRGTAARLAWLLLESVSGLPEAATRGMDWKVKAMVAETLASGHVRELCAYLETLPEMEWQFVARTLANGPVRELCAYLEERVK